MILTEQEVIRLWDSHVVPIFGKSGINPVVFAQLVESAVLEKLKAQEPVGYMDEQGVLWESVDDNILPSDKPLYLHPLPPDDVVQKYEELLYAVHRKFPDETRHQTALRYIKTAESPSYTNAAMKEMK